MKRWLRWVWFWITATSGALASYALASAGSEWALRRLGIPAGAVEFVSVTIAAVAGLAWVALGLRLERHRIRNGG